MVDNNATAVQNALQAGGIQLALPQRLEPVTTREHQVQKVVYDPEKLAAVKAALGIQRPAMSRWEAVANALAQTPEARSFTGGFGEEIINPFASGFSTFARNFGNVYSALKADERTKAEQAREDAIKAAEMEMEASKQNVTDKVTDSQMKVNDPNAKSTQEMAKALESLKALYALKEENRKLVGDFDNAYTVKDKDGNVDVDKTLANYRGASGINRTWKNPNAWYGFATSKKEADARNKLTTLRETQLNNIYQSLKGAGSITDTELQTMGKTASEAYNPYLLDLSISNTIRNLEAKYGLNQQPKYVIEEIQ